MKLVRHMLPACSMLQVAQWCREHDTPLLITFVKRNHAYPPQEYDGPFPAPEIVRVTGKSIIRGLKGKTFPGPPKRRGMCAIVRDQDFDLFRLRF